VTTTEPERLLTAVLACGAFMAPEDRTGCAAESDGAALAVGAQIEVAFACGFDRTTRQLTRPRLLARGHQHEVPARVTDLRHGEMHVHTHPGGNLLPSDKDLVIAHDLALLGAGCAIAAPDFTRFYVVVEPAPPRVAHPFPRRTIRVGRRLYSLQRLT
jgi:ATP-dependent DNA helicase DinG